MDFHFLQFDETAYRYTRMTKFDKAKLVNKLQGKKQIMDAGHVCSRCDTTIQPEEEAVTCQEYQCDTHDHMHCASTATIISGLPLFCLEHSKECINCRVLISCSTKKNTNECATCIRHTMTTSSAKPHRK
jgi:hypothetical protein